MRVEKMADVLRGLEDEIMQLDSDNISTCMLLYDKLDAHVKDLPDTDAKMQKILQRIIEAKVELSKNTINVSSLTAATYEVKRESLHPLIFNYTSEQDSDHVWKFLRSTDTDTEEKMNSLGFALESHQEWALKNRINTNISDVDNLVAKCMCRLDHFLKDFVFLPPNNNNVQVNHGTVEPHLNALLQLVLQLDVA